MWLTSPICLSVTTAPTHCHEATTSQMYHQRIHEFLHRSSATSAIRRCRQRFAHVEPWSSAQSPRSVQLRAVWNNERHLKKDLFFFINVIYWSYKPGGHKINVRAEPTIKNERTLWYDNDIWAGRYYMGDMAVMMWRYNVVKLGFTARLWAIEAIPAPFDLTSCLLHLRPYTKLILSNRMFFRLLTVKSHNHPFHGTTVLMQNMFLNGFVVRHMFMC